MRMIHTYTDTQDNAWKYRAIYNIKNKHNATIYKCDTPEILQKFYDKNKDIISHVVITYMKVYN